MKWQFLSELRRLNKRHLEYQTYETREDLEEFLIGNVRELIEILEAAEDHICTEFNEEDCALFKAFRAFERGI